MTDTSYGSFQPYYSWRRMSMPPVAVAAQRPNSDSPTLSSLLSSSSNSNDSPPAIVLAQPYNPRRAPSASRDNSNSSSNEGRDQDGDDSDDTGGGGGHKGPCQIVCLIWSMFVTGFVVLWAVFSLYKALA